MEFVHNLWRQKGYVEPTRHRIVRAIAKMEHSLPSTSESVRNPVVRDREQSLGSLNEVCDAAAVLANLAQTPPQLLRPPLGTHTQGTAIVYECFQETRAPKSICADKKCCVFHSRRKRVLCVSPMECPGGNRFNKILPHRGEWRVFIPISPEKQVRTGSLNPHISLWYVTTYVCSADVKS